MAATYDQEAMQIPLLVLLLALVFLTLSYLGRPYWGWVVAAGLGLAWWAAGGMAWPVVFGAVATVLALLAIAFGVVPLRRAVLTPALMRFMGKILPRMSDTEREALEAGSVWWDRELF